MSEPSELLESSATLLYLLSSSSQHTSLISHQTSLHVYFNKSSKLASNTISEKEIKEYATTNEEKVEN